MAQRRHKDSLEDGSFPAGDGGRVHVPIHRGRNGQDLSIDPENSGIYSGMTKRNARQTGCFTNASIEDAEYE
jgi:hypothetical protein